MPIRLIVKGNREEAKRECIKRGIPFEFNYANPIFPETSGECPNEHLAKVTEWFAEATKVNQSYPDKLPFPIGTLIFFNTY